MTEYAKSSNDWTFDECLRSLKDFVKSDDCHGSVIENKIINHSRSIVHQSDGYSWYVRTDS